MTRLKQAAPFIVGSTICIALAFLVPDCKSLGLSGSDGEAVATYAGSLEACVATAKLQDAGTQMAFYEACAASVDKTFGVSQTVASVVDSGADGGHDAH